jgi:ribosome-associated protein
VHEVTIRGDSIRLGQLLKLAGLIDSGAEAKSLLAADQVRVNGEPEIRRGRQLRDGDVVAAAGQELRVSADSAKPGTATLPPGK